MPERAFHGPTIAAAAVLCFALALAAAQVPEAPLDVRKTDEARFTAGPRAAREGGLVKVAFAASAPTDVEVSVIDARGRVVRHLAAGLLGPNAPEPLAKDSLAQSISWDGRDYAVRPAAGGPLRFRVRLGSQPRLDQVLGWDGNTFGGAVAALTVSPAGEVYVLLTDSYRGRSELRVLDSAGRYKRTIMPYPSATPPARSEPVGHLMADGERLPIVFNGQGHTLHPIVSGLSRQTMAWHPGGRLLASSSVGTMAEHGPPRHLIAFHPQGGAPEGVGFVGPKVREARGFIGGSGEGGAFGMDRLAVSPDGTFIYFNQSFESRIFQEKERRHGIYRLRWTDRATGDLWLGRPEPGDDDEHFSDPQGIAVDAAGRLYVCDRGNNRIMLFSPDGKLLGKAAAETPEQIAVHPRTGQVFVLSRPAGKNAERGRLLCFSAWRDGGPVRQSLSDGGPQKSAELDVPKIDLMALDPSADPARLWIAVKTGWITPHRIIPVTVTDGRFALGEPVGNDAGLWYPTSVVADPDRGRIVVKELLRYKRYFSAIDMATGNVTELKLPGTDIALDADGNMYLLSGYRGDHVGWISRYDSAGRPLPFSGTGSEKTVNFTFRCYGPDMGVRGHAIHPNGDIYLLRSTQKDSGAEIEIFGPDGRHKRTLVRGLGGGDCGLGVDAAGNVYVGTNIKPAAAPLPAPFAGLVPADAWQYWRKGERPAPWCYPYCNAYLFHMGAVMKFGPEGGAVYGYQRKSSPGGGNWPVASPGMELEKAPADATAYKTAYLAHDVKVSGALWRYGGIGIVPASIDGPAGDPGCVCLVSQLDADPWGRVYAPNVFRFSVEMLDSNGNHIARIGRYGNADDGRTAGTAADGGIFFAWPADCDYAEADGRLYVSDSVNRRVLVIRFDHAADAACDIP